MTVSTITPKQQQQISDLLSTMTLSAGVGAEENACSIVAINLALTGEPTYRIPDCMSEVIGRWIIVTQDGMPAEMRNSAEWKRLLPLAAGTGRKREHERLAIVMEWMRGTVLPTLQPLADRHGFGKEWRTMISERTAVAARTAAHTAYVANAHTAATAAFAVATAAFTTAAGTTAAAAAHTALAAAAQADADAWQQFNPCGLLERLIAAN